MRCFTTLLLTFFSLITFCQEANFKINEFNKLPPEIVNSNNQFSGLFISDNKLFMLCESRDTQEAKLFVVNPEDLIKKMKDTSQSVDFKKMSIYNLDILINKINNAGHIYEGLEAIIVDSNEIYLSVETRDTSHRCYLLKGHLQKDSVILNPNFLFALPRQNNNIYNAGFESFVKLNDLFFTFFEYNYSSPFNKAYIFNRYSFVGNNCINTLPISKLPFRLTDVTHTGGKHFTGINYFFKDDNAVYRPATSDIQNDTLVRVGNKYQNYCRLIDIKLTDSGFTWNPLWEFPKETDYMKYNWEGIAYYKDGYFVVNDYYTPKKNEPASKLIYLEKIKQPIK